jgi:hypothetical protein
MQGVPATRRLREAERSCGSVERTIQIAAKHSSGLGSSGDHCVATAIVTPSPEVRDESGGRSGRVTRSARPNVGEAVQRVAPAPREPATRQKVSATQYGGIGNV